jgi:hypothetical protein
MIDGLVGIVLFPAVIFPASLIDSSGASMSGDPASAIYGFASMLARGNS